VSSRASAAHLVERLRALFQDHLPAPSRYWVAFSGGPDSTVLLHLLAKLRGELPAPLAAVHVDHGLHPDSVAWGRHCEGVCDRLDLPLQSLRVDATPGKGESPEAVARDRRYAAIDAVLEPGSMLLTAHHRDDQAETLLLQLLRGAGVAGLAGMPLLRPWGDKWQGRPLLDIARADLRTWGERQGLSWIDDPSNAQLTADRNYLRHRIIPDLLLRWPGALESIARSAGHCADAAELAALQAERDLAVAGGAGSRVLHLVPLRQLSAARQRAVLRHWLAAAGAPPLSSRRLSDARHQLLQGRSDADIRIVWRGWQLRRYRDTAWLLADSRLTPPVKPIPWVGDRLELAAGLGTLRRVARAGGIDPQRWHNGRVEVVYRDPGVRCRPAGRQGSRDFKAIMQEAGIPPWQRPIVPIVRIDGQTAAIANCCVCEPFAVGPTSSGWWVEWAPASGGVISA
jgi:tRNA(Ile)-lysidine synthase